MCFVGMSFEHFGRLLVSKESSYVTLTRSFISPVILSIFPIRDPIMQIWYSVYFHSVICSEK